MKKIIFLAMLFASSVAKAQTTIEIQVVDKNSGQGIQSINLYEGELLVASTDISGKAIIDRPVGKVIREICAKNANYTKECVSVNMTSVIVKIELVDNANSIGDIVITATRTEESTNYLAQPVQKITLKEMTFQQQSTVPDILAANGNVFVQKSQLGGGSPIIRGFETNKVLLVLDGVRMNNAIYRGGHLQNSLTVDNGMLESVEVSYGPSSVMYGSDALGGVMHFISKRPVLSLTDKVLVSGSASGRYFSAASGNQYHADINVANKGIASLTSFTFSNFNDLRQGGKGLPGYPDQWNRTFSAQRIDGKDSMVVQKNGNYQTGSAYSQFDLMQKFLIKQSDEVHHLVNFQYSRSSDINRYDRLTLLQNNKPRFAEWYYGPAERLMLSYQLQLTNKNNLYDQGTVTGAFQNIEESRNDRRFNNKSKNFRTEELNIYSINADFKKTIGIVEISYGAEIVSNSLTSTAFKMNILTEVKSPQTTRYPDGGSLYNSQAAYVSGIVKLAKKLTLNIGARYSHVMLSSRLIDKTLFKFDFDQIKQNNTALTGNVGLVFMPTDNIKVYTLISTGFRAPNVDDLSKIFETTTGDLILPNPDLKSEKTINHEIGFAVNLAKRVKWSTSAYYTLINDIIVTKFGQYNGLDSVVYDGVNTRVQINQNAANAYIGGIESNIRITPIRNLEVYSSVTYTRGRLLSAGEFGAPLDHIPPMFGRTGINYTYKKLRGEVFANYSHRKLLSDYRLNAEDNEAYATVDGMPAWATFNVRLAYQISKNFSAQLAAENILDQRYRSFASNISAPGRNIIATVKVNF